MLVLAWTFVRSVLCGVKLTFSLASAVRLLLEAFVGIASKASVKELEEKIMSKISEYGEAQAAVLARIDTAIQGIQGDIDELNRKIAELQNSPGAITPADQAILDDLQAKGLALAERLDALDALTPAVVVDPLPEDQTGNRRNRRT